MHRSIVLGVLALAGILIGLAPAPALAATRYVAANGLDTATCGTAAAPCRSISRAIDRAVAGDKIVVGPGRYGDVDRDGVLASPGDEASGHTNVTVLISKRVTVVSSAGAAATVIEHPSTTGWAVLISGSGAGFGQRDKGFTVRSGAVGIEVIGADVTVQDNRILAAAAGVKSEGGGHTTIVNNVISGADVGVAVLASAAVVSGNVLESNGTAIVVGGAGAQTELEGNSIVNSASIGILAAVTTTVSRNLLAGNGTGGIVVLVPGSITSNNFIGNGVTDATRCGIVTVAAIAVNAERNYWGSAQGPDADPGDRVCGVGIVDTAPFLTRAVGIPVTAGK
jgi:hypothetical protein